MAFTFFFRDNHTLENVIKFLLPLVSGYSRVKIWDAGCANGSEAYTFAIMLAENMGYFGFKNIEIDATDIDENDTFRSIIYEGIYPINELIRIPNEIFEKYFRKSEIENYYLIDEKIRNKVKFLKNDLLKFNPVSNNYHLVICKNVLLHFHPEERIKVIEMFHSVLNDNGLFTTEQTQQLPEECNHLFIKIASDANIYQKISLKT